MDTYIPYGKQHIIQDDIDAVVEVLQSDFITQGPCVPRFEDAMANYCHVKFAVAVNSATSALHLACRALGLGEGDWLWTTPITFVASANCALYCGAKVDFVDIDPRTYNMSIKSLEEKLERADKVGALPKVLVAVHLCGQSCEMDKIYSLGQKYGFRIIEDASHAVGGKYQGEPVGNCRYSDISVFSFHPVKIITTAEGGMALTNQSDLAEKMELLRSHGVTRDPGLMTQVSDGPWYYQQIELGYNYRLTELQAALGLSQLERLDSYVALRHELASRYNCLLEHLPVDTPFEHNDCYSGLHLYVIRLRLSELGISHLDFFTQLRSLGVGVNLHYIPIYKQPYYSSFGFSSDDFPQAEKYYKEAISLPMFATMTYEQQDFVVSAIEKLLN